MSCSCRSICDHNFSARTFFTSLWFGSFLLLFATFLSVTPSEHLMVGVESIQGASQTVSGAFGIVATVVNGTTADFFHSQLALVEDTGALLARTGTLIGTGAGILVFRPEDVIEQAHMTAQAMHPFLYTRAAEAAVVTQEGS